MTTAGALFILVWFLFLYPYLAYRFGRWAEKRGLQFFHLSKGTVEGSGKRPNFMKARAKPNEEVGY